MLVAPANILNSFVFYGLLPTISETKTKIDQTFETCR